MALMLSGNMDAEIWRAQVAAELGDEAVTELAAPYPEDRPIIVPNALGRDPVYREVFKAVLLLNRASNWEEFREALRYWHVPSQDFVYADIDGKIGYQAPGRVPIRANGDGQMPVPGWTDEFEWAGYIPYEELPHRFNPPEGFIVTANNAVVDDTYPYLISLDWNHGYRAQRITEMIEALDQVSVDDSKRIHGDNKSLAAGEIIPYLTAVRPEKPAVRQALDRRAEAV